MNKANPMVLSFHGNGKDMDYQAAVSRFNDSSINPNMIAVFPQGLPGDDLKERCWEGAPYCKNTGASDKVFVTDLLNHMRENYCVDDFRIYASGKSIGGGFVDVLACSQEHGGDFAAFAMDAAAIYTEADGSSCKPARSLMPILELHGTDDKTANYSGEISHDEPLPNIRSVLEDWATRNGCGPSPVPAINELRDNRKVYYTQYDCKGVQGAVVGYNVTGQGHWCISKKKNGDNKGHVAPIEASTIMMNFFDANSKP